MVRHDPENEGHADPISWMDLLSRSELDARCLLLDPPPTRKCVDAASPPTCQTAVAGDNKLDLEEFTMLLSSNDLQAKLALSL